ncbi:secondary thiamine-phosphate synthase enzyme YjbQ [Pontivivens nitratireducens]|uniref:YjbQ family protein n=1 Tax=Pontivivens nitratireducens TaxID=2758038 RepID=A0A6G7VNU2_9RHOB|nr:secondary thiamine-phosphate synthase enzyme YjbQ [Pontibrevibacter nitratireducens]QIK41674.1 YjbQ family protein [Pontibrevibacter nitratireducens]
MQTTLRIHTRGAGLTEFTPEVQALVERHGREASLASLFVQHTSCSLLIQENADPDVCRDLRAFFDRMVPDANDPAMRYLTHRAEGPDDMPAHIKAAVLPVSLNVPIAGGALALGTWQGLYLFEHRSAPHERKVVVTLI